MTRPVSIMWWNPGLLHFSGEAYSYTYNKYDRIFRTQRFQHEQCYMTRPVSILWWNPGKLNVDTSSCQLLPPVNDVCILTQCRHPPSCSYILSYFHTHSSHYSHFITVVTTFREELDDRSWKRIFIKPGHRTVTHFHQARSQNSALFIINQVTEQQCGQVTE